MTGRASRIFWAWAALAIDLGCSSQLTGPPKDGGSDARAAADGGTMDPAACGCALESDHHTLDMSMECLCARYNCDSTPPLACSGSTGSQHWTVACGLTVFSGMTFGGPDVWVYDGAGRLVGVQYSSDLSEYACPSDPSLKAFAVKAGRFPDSGCPVQECACDAGGSCASVDAGAAD